MARIALNGRLLVPGKLEGIGTFTLHCLRELVARRPNDAFLLVVDRPDDAMFHLGPNVEVRRICVPGRRPWLLWWWFNVSLPRMLRQWQADAWVSLEGPLAGNMRPSFPQLAVIHDLNFEHHPEWLPKTWANYYRSTFPGIARNAHVLCTVSAHSANDLAATYGIPRDPIRIVPNAASELFRPLTSAQRHTAQATFCGGHAYFVFVGSLHPRKNLDGLLRAFAAYVREGGRCDLLVVGEAMWRGEPRPEVAACAGRIHWAGRLERDALAGAVGGAEALVFVPWFEGFGIPVLEAMAAGVPVVCSNTTSLPEVCGDAAFALVDPADVAAIAAAMHALESQPERREEAIGRGAARVASFSWRRSGELLDAAVTELLSNASGPARG